MPSPDVEISEPGLDRSARLTVSHTFTLFPLVSHNHQSSLFLHDRDSMAIMSHEIESHLARTSRIAHVFAGFQKLSKFMNEEHRYRHLAGLGHTIYIFGVPDVLPSSIPNINFIFLTDNDALAREWFVITDTPEFYSALVAEELLEISSQAEIQKIGPKGLYHGLWTFDPLLISELVHHLKDELGLLDALQSANLPHDPLKQVDAIVASANHLVSELELRNQALDAQQRKYEDLVNMLVHDMRGSLTSVIGSLELIASGRIIDKVETQELVENSLENSRRLSNMISNLLDINKFEAGHLTLKHEVVNLHDLTGPVISRWKAASAWSGKKVVVNLSPDLPLIIGDSSLLERVLDNLLSNALKYGSNVKLLVHGSGKSLYISVTDDGPGIPPADRQVIFEKFRAANLGTDQRKGTGLGLAFCKMAVEAHGGSIQIFDAMPHGAEFRVELPLSLPDPIRPKKNSRKKEK